VLFVALTLGLSLLPLPEQAAQPAPPRVHLIRSTSGSRGAAQGARFVMEDPRTLFHAGQDRQVLVLFEWQGPAGRHRCEGQWKDPSGRVVFTSTSDVEARGPRFGVYWGLSLPDRVAIGTWVMEASVDGEPAGVHAFQILTGPGDSSAAPARRTLAVAEIYERGLGQTLTLEALDASGALIATASGFFVSPDLVSTSFGSVNAASKVRLVTTDGRRLETSDVVSWNRRDDWVIFRFRGANGTPPLPSPEPPQVGDRCFFLEAGADGGRVIVETSIVGRSPTGDLSLGDVAGEASLGGPVFNEFGEIVAKIAGSGIAGASVLELYGLADPARRVEVRGARARPLDAAPSEGAASRTLSEIEQAGGFVRPLARTPHFVSGVMGTGIEKQGQIPVAVDQRFHFSRADGQCVVFVTWVPSGKEDTTLHFELYDEDNRRLAATEPVKARLRSGQSFVQYWQLKLAGLKPGLHRVDAMAGASPVWRSFFRLTE
jgi:hypothetical protein